MYHSTVTLCINRQPPLFAFGLLCLEKCDPLWQLLKTTNLHLLLLNVNYFSKKCNLRATDLLFLEFSLHPANTLSV